MESRLEPRRQIELIVWLKGQDKQGECFTQEALASSISVCGALLSGIGREIRSGDLVWLDYAGRKARFKVVLGQRFCVSVHSSGGTTLRGKILSVEAGKIRSQ